VTIEYDEKGKYYTDIVRKFPMPVVIQTTTDATVYGAEDKALFTASFMAVHREQIVWILPVDEAQKKGQSQ